MARTKNVERLADALQACFKDAVEEGKRTANGLDIRTEFAKQDERITLMFNKQNETAAKQNRTLRMIWNQVKGKGPLPIDED